MKERPILFSGPMVKAILAGAKTQTRRVIKPQTLLDTHTRVTACYKCPYGQPGDRLWVRESMHEDADGVWVFDADDEPIGCDNEDDHLMIRWVMRNERTTCPAMFMPRWASRLTLEVTDVRVQRLNDISEMDCEKELGVKPYSLGNAAYGEFGRLWDKINGARGYTWDSNPFVWVVCFSKVEP